MTVRRGYIHMVRLPDVYKPKTALVVASDVICEYLKPIVVQVTTTARLRELPTFVPLRKGEGGLREDSYALCHELHTLDHAHIDEEPLGEMISLRRLVAVENAIRHALDIELAA